MPAAVPTALSVGIKTLGCRLNQFESDGILARFGAAGYRLVDFDSGPDVAIINTCTVTDQADATNRNTIRRAVRNNPDAAVIVTGCFAQTDPEVIASIEGVALVLGNDRKSSLFQIVHDRLVQAGSGPPRAAFASTFAAASLPDRMSAVTRTAALPQLDSPFDYASAVPVGHTRGYLKIQDGCDRNCSYCKIPQARGRGVSRAFGDIMEHVARLEDQGVPEIVVTGVNLGWYQDPDTGLRLNGLLEQIVTSLRFARLRLSSIEPPDVGPELAEVMTHPRFCSFLHMPLQSGSARILRAMRRTYNPRSFRLRTEAFRRILPDVSLGTDVIVGFPGESEGDFDETTALLEDLHFANIHPFRFSARAGTTAASLENRVAADVVRSRMERLLAMRALAKERYAELFLGTVRELVVEGQSPDHLRGTTDNFIQVAFLPGSPEPTPGGALMDVRLDRWDDQAGLVLGTAVLSAR